MGFRPTEKDAHDSFFRKRNRQTKRLQGSNWQAKRKGVFERDRHKCVKCGGEEHLTVDHIIPRSRGGGNNHENLQTMCITCNGEKGDTMPDEFFNYPKSHIMLKTALNNKLWKSHHLGDKYKMDGKGEWKIAYYPIFEDGKTGEKYDEARALIETPIPNGTDFREIPLRYLERI